MDADQVGPFALIHVIRGRQFEVIGFGRENKISWDSITERTWKTSAWILVLRGCTIGATPAAPSRTTYCFEISVRIRVNP